MSVSTVRLLHAASDIAGGPEALADRLGIDESLLAKFMKDTWPLPDALLLRAVDIVLADRQAGRVPEPSAPVTAKAVTG